MGRYVRPGFCVDCGAAVGAAEVCGTCGLAQSGPDFDELWRVLTVADRLLEAAPRSAAVGLHPFYAAAAAQATASSGSADDFAEAPPPQSPTVFAPYPPPAHHPAKLRGPRLPAMSTPAILLSLGALCFLVAAVVFVTVTWSDLSLAAKAAIMLAVTAVISGLAWAVARRGLRGSAEALSTLAVLLVVLDYLAARSGGLANLDALPRLTAEAVGGSLLAVTGTGWAWWATRTPVRSLTGAQLAAVVGFGYLAGLGIVEWPWRVEFAGFLAAPLLAGLALAARTQRLRTGAVGLATVSVAVFVYGSAEALRRVVESTTLGSLWGDGDVAGWLVVCGVAATVAVLERLARVARTLGAAATLTGLALVVLRPLEGNGQDAAVIATAAVLVLLCGVTLTIRGTWGRGARLATAGPFLLILMLTSTALGVVALVVAEPLLTPWELATTARIDVPWESGLAVGPLFLGVAVLIMSGAVVVRRSWPSPVTATVAVVLGGLVVLLCDDLPLWAVVLALGTAALATAVLVVVRPSTVLGSTCVALCAGTLAASGGSAWTTAVAALVVAGLLVAVARSVNGEVGLAFLVAVPLVGLSAAAWTAVADGPVAARGVAAVCVGVVAALLAQLPAVRPRVDHRQGVEGGSVILFLCGTYAASGDGLLLPVALTLTGAALVAVSLLSADRRPLSAPGGVLLASATWVRLAYEDVTLVEAYTLPSAVVLVVLGLRHLLRNRGAATLPVLGGGLALALLPSLVRTLPEPTSARALVLGLVAVLVLVAGAYLRWAAPLLTGGVVVLTLAVVNVAPYAQALPRWTIFAAVGAGLLYLGMTWERRLGNLRSLGAVLERLR